MSDVNRAALHARRRRARRAGRMNLRVEELETRLVPSGFARPQLTFLPATTGNVSPTEMRAAYGVNNIKFGSTMGTGANQTIVLLDAYNDPTIASDLASFDSTFGLAAPPSFKVLNQNLQTSPLPATSVSWGLEESLDVEWSHVIAPQANLILVEANSSSYSDLFTGAKNAGSISPVVSMSFGGGESSGETAYDSTFTTPGVSYLAAAGDSGARVIYPSASPNVVSVGGTYLVLSSKGGYGGESAWREGGGGASAYEPQPAFETSVQTVNTTGRRGTPDISMDSSPYSGVELYDTNGYGGLVGGVGGTSLATPMWAALTAIANQGRAVAGKGTLSDLPADLYSLASTDFHDITKGSNGYSAGTGYDFATGRGTPKSAYLVPALANLASGAVQEVSGGSGSGGGFARPMMETATTGVGPAAVTGLKTGATPAASFAASAATATSHTASSEGISIGGPGTNADERVLLAHSTPDSVADLSAAPIATEPMPSDLSLAGASGSIGIAYALGNQAIASHPSINDAAFAGGAAWIASDTSASESNDAEDGFLDSAAAAGMAAFLGGVWTTSKAESATRANRRRKA